MDPVEQHYLDLTRRRFFGTAAKSIGAGLGSMALASLLRAEPPPRVEPGRHVGAKLIGTSPAPHFAPKAKRVIYLHMEGAPSQLDLYDYKPGLRHRFNQDLPDSIRQGQRLTGMTSKQARFPIGPSIFRFKRYANRQDGIWISELMPHVASVAHELCFVHSMYTDAINHEPGISFFQTGNE